MNEPLVWQVVVESRAEKELNRLPRQDRHRVLEALERLRGGLQLGDVKKLSGFENEWRLRVGNWRVRFRPDFTAGVLVILRVLPRGSAYRD